MTSATIRSAAIAILLTSVSGLALAQSPAPDAAAPTAPSAAPSAPSAAPAAPSATPAAPSATPAAPSATPAVPDATMGARAPSDRPASSLSTHIPSPNDAAKFNPAADANDKKPTMAHAFAFTDEQRRQLSGMLSGKAQEAGQRSDFKPEVAARMPASAKVNDLPSEVIAQMPTLKPYKYALVDDKILLVDPVNGYLVVEILNR